MKISDLTTDQALDVFCEITPALEEILFDEELLVELKRKIEKREGMTKIERLKLYVEKITKIIPVVFKKKRNAVYTIVSALNGTDCETVKTQNIIKTMQQFKEMADDEALVDFVLSCWKTEKSAS